MNNTNFVIHAEKSGLSYYRIAQMTGLSYSLIHNLKTGALNINNCSGTVLRKLSVCLNTAMENLMNETDYINGIRGIHRKIQYEWVTNHGSVLVFTADGKKHEIVTGKNYNVPKTACRMQSYAEFLIDDYLSRQRR